MRQGRSKSAGLLLLTTLLCIVGPLRGQEQPQPAAPAPKKLAPPPPKVDHHHAKVDHQHGSNHVVSRLIHLYYYRDADRVAEIINSSARLKSNEELEGLKRRVEETQIQASTLASQLRALETRIQLASRTTSSGESLIPVQANQPGGLSESLVELLTQRQSLASQEQQMREQLFRLESELTSAGRGAFVVGDREAEDPVSQVSLTVVGEGELHLRGPHTGVNKIVRIIHQIDKPVGQVKVRLHTVQVNGDKGDAMEAVHDAIDAHINHARALSMHAALLFPRAVSKVFSEVTARSGGSPDVRCFFCKRFEQEFEAVNRLSTPLTQQTGATMLTAGAPTEMDGPLSIDSIDGSSLLGALYMTALAEDEVREAIRNEFLKSVREELAADEVAYYELLKRAESKDRFASGLLFGRYLQKAPQITPEQIRSWAADAFTFSNLSRLLASQSTGIDALNSVQSSTLQLAKGLRNLYVLERELQNLLLERSLFERTAGEIEARATEAKRQLEASKAALQQEGAEAEAAVASVVSTVLAGLNEMTVKGMSGPEQQRPMMVKFQQHLKRLEDEAVQKELAYLVLNTVLRCDEDSQPITDDELAQMLYWEIAVYMQQTLGVVFEFSETESNELLGLAQNQIVPRAERLRAAARQWTLAKSRTETAEQQYQQAVQNNDLCSRQLFAKRVLDQFIDEQEEKVAGVWENLRPHVATIDSYLKQMAIAFEDDINAQFYKPAFQDIRRAAREWDVALGQIENTTILTNDRTPAKVSPAQTVQFDLPKRQLLVTEAVSTGEALVSESRSLMTKLGVRTAANAALGPAGSPLVDSVPVAAPFGSALQQQIPQSRIFTLEAGNDFSITPVIQPDGYSIAYRFDYIYSTNVNEPVGPDERSLPRIKRHFVKTQVQTSSYELREISRFRVAFQTARSERGVPLLEDVPLLGKLFRPPVSRGVSLQENIILADCVVYPTVFDLTGRRWLKPAEYIKAEPLLATNPAQQNRQQELRNRLLAITREEVENLLGIPPEPPRTATRPTHADEKR